MQCLICGTDMQVALVVHDRTMPVPGFEHRTLTCLACGETEQRLCFTQEVAQAPAQDDEGTLARGGSPEEEPAATHEHVAPPAAPSLPEPIAVPAAPSAPERPRGAWALAIERIRLHQTSLEQRSAVPAAATDTQVPDMQVTDRQVTNTQVTDTQITAMRVTDRLAAAMAQPTGKISAASPAGIASMDARAAPSRAASRPPSAPDEFDRLWESLARPLPAPAAAYTAIVPTGHGGTSARQDATDRTTEPERPVEAAPVAPLPPEPPPAPPIAAVAAAPIVVAPAPAEPEPPTETRATAASAQDIFPNALTRALAILRGGKQRNDAILRIGGQGIPKISEEALRLTPPSRPLRRA
jgi:hypothetical protein